MDDNVPAEDADFYSSDPPPTCAAPIRKLFDYWRSIHPPGGGLPGRQHFDPVDIPALLSSLWLLNVQHAPLRFKYRLLGTEHVRIMERDVTGKWADEVFPLFTTSAAYPQFVACAERGEVQYRSGKPLFHLPRDYLSMERLLLPLARDGEIVDIVLAITIYHRRS